MSTYFKTAEVARDLGRTYHQVFNLIRMGLILPRKDGSGDYCWTPADVRAAARHLRKAKAARETAGATAD